MTLAGALLACNLSQGGGDDGDGGDGGGNQGGASDTTPTVQILSPTSGAQVPINQRVDITVATDSTTTSFVLNVGGRVASTKAMPPGQSGAAQAILSWQPERLGSYSLEVIAFNGSRASAPAAILLDVSGVVSQPSDGGTGGCTGRVLVSELNFRSGAGTGASVLGKFDVGEPLTVVGRNADTSWYQVQRYNAQQVWVINNSQWLQVEGACASLPVTG